jgi:hypothetical protein
MYLDGVLVRRRRFAAKGRRIRISVPTVSYAGPEYIISRILSADGRFSLDKHGDVFVTQVKGYQRREEERLYVSGLSLLVDEAADHYFLYRPEGGRMELQPSALICVASHELLAQLERA